MHHLPVFAADLVTADPENVSSQSQEGRFDTRRGGGVGERGPDDGGMSDVQLRGSLFYADADPKRRRTHVCVL